MPSGEERHSLGLSPAKPVVYVPKPRRQEPSVERIAACCSRSVASYEQASANREEPPNSRTSAPSGGLRSMPRVDKMASGTSEQDEAMLMVGPEEHDERPRF